MFNIWNISFFLLLSRCQFGIPMGYKSFGCFDKHYSFEMASNVLYTDPLLTPQRCLARCSRQWHLYFMLTDGKICACFGDDLRFRNYKISEQCNSPCKGDTLQECGGEFSVEIFKVSYCSELMEPLNGFLHQTLQNASFWCKEGYHLQGSKHIQCNKTVSEWNGLMNPVCYKSCGISVWFLTMFILTSLGMLFFMASFLYIRRKFEALKKSKESFDIEGHMEEPYVYMTGGPKKIIDILTKRSVSSPSENDVAQQDSTEETDSKTTPEVTLEDEIPFGDYYVLSCKESMQKSKTLPQKLHKVTEIPKLDVIDEDEIY
ncbi:hypothetical protein HOLleu_23270 [Holothuria leucospilota]|uniref:WSC domain-containing protein n=1 Tax=Holothuria leucospilota TaxID=206669 RepID=A0A9Q1BV36_HOLLE|nr:hypothetical protein HOLleu_23270 [Holothuria leucospilota]